MAGSRELVPVDAISNLIHVVRGHRVMLDSDSARLYGVATKRLNEQVKRNRTRFPEDFAFRLTAAEGSALRSQIATSNVGRGGRRYAPLVFTDGSTAQEDWFSCNSRGAVVLRSRSVRSRWIGGFASCGRTGGQARSAIAANLKELGYGG